MNMACKMLSLCKQMQTSSQILGLLRMHDYGASVNASLCPCEAALPHERKAQAGQAGTAVSSQCEASIGPERQAAAPRGAEGGQGSGGVALRGRRAGGLQAVQGIQRAVLQIQPLPTLLCLNTPAQA